MAGYQILLIERPREWKPDSWDDVPPEPGPVLQILGEPDDLWAAMRRTSEHNKAAQQENGPTWAVIVEPGVRGRFWPEARLCTPLNHRVAGIWWPEGWEPQSPFDVPNCVWQAPSDIPQEQMTYVQALAVVQGLNRQSMNHPGATWHVLVAVENEPVSQSVSYDPAGTETTVEVRRMHVLRAQEGGKGDCSYCPAHHQPCAQDRWVSLQKSTTSTRTRSLGRPR